MIASFSTKWYSQLYHLVSTKGSAMTPEQKQILKQRNPSPGVPKNALTGNDIKANMQIVVVRDGKNYQDLILIKSAPYFKDGNFRVKAQVIKSGPAGALIPRRSRVHEEYLCGMGLCPNAQGKWQPYYALHADSKH